MREARTADQPGDRIRLSGIVATGYHGVLDHERREGQTFVADVVLHVDTRPAAAEDRLDLTVHYGVLAEQVEGVLRGEPADLLETVAERIAAVALTHPTVLAVDVVVHKPQAPIAVPFGDVTVEIRRDREHPAVVAPPPVVVGPEEIALEDVAPRPAEHTEHVEVVADLGPATGVIAVVAPADDRLDVAPDGPVEVVLALGSNVGASTETLRAAIRDLAELDGLEVTAVSPLARTAAVGGPEQPDFLNAVVLGRTTLAPRALLHACQAVEQTHGRERLEPWGPRTLDVDIVLHGSTVAVTDDLELPHPRANQRAFVLQPWAQVDPDAVLPGLGGGPVAALAQTAPDREGIRWMALDWWHAPEAAP